MAKPTKAESVKEIERAEKALAAAKAAHRVAFKKAILTTYEEYCLALEADGDRIKIVPYSVSDKSPTIALPE